MKRKVLLIIGKSDLFLPGNYSFEDKKIIEKLQSRNDIELVVIGRYNSQYFDIDKLKSEISGLNPEQPLTIIALSHGSYEYSKGFEFLLDENTRVSSLDLFDSIGNIMRVPVDVFTTACHGEGILYDKDKLPIESTLVGLTDAEATNSSSDFQQLQDSFDDFYGEITAYDLLQFYLSKCLKNRFHPHIGITGGGDYSLDSILKTKISNPMDFDYLHFASLGSTDEYKQILYKITNSKSEYSIYAAEYGIALSIILNDLRNSGKLTVSKEFDISQTHK